MAKTVRAAVIALVGICCSWGSVSFAQSASVPLAPASYVLVGLGAFLPLEQSYRINYSTKTLGLPIELDASLLMPVTPTVLLQLSATYLDRTANFINDTRISSVMISPGVRVYLEPERPKDFRIFAIAGFVLSRSAVSSVVEATPDGEDPVPQSITRTYLPLGGAAGLGLTYPLSAQTAIDATVRATVFFGSPASSGGLGNIGGVSLIASYRFGL